MNDDRQGFFRRWSNRKSESRQGQVAAPESPRISEPRVSAEPRPASDAHGPQDGGMASTVPTLQEVEHLTPSSDFSDFVRQEVPAKVKNAALKKLFADPHFNVMDGLDVYIDDYSQPDPLAPSMLRQMASAKFLKLVDAPEDSPQTVQTGDAFADVLPRSTAPCPTSNPSPETLNHDHADLRLQPDPDAGPSGAGAPSA